MRAYDKIKAGLKEAIAHERGVTRAVTVRLSVAPVKHWNAAEIKQIRLNTGLTQQVFADVMGVSNKAIEAWEAGRNIPNGSAGRMLAMIQQDPQLPVKMNILLQ